jgi:hypothetical protein
MAVTAHLGIPQGVRVISAHTIIHRWQCANTTSISLSVDNLRIHPLALMVKQFLLAWVAIPYLLQLHILAEPHLHNLPTCRPLISTSHLMILLCKPWQMNGIPTWSFTSLDPLHRPFHHFCFHHGYQVSESHLSVLIHDNSLRISIHHPYLLNRLLAMTLLPTITR